MSSNTAFRSNYNSTQRGFGSYGFGARSAAQFPGFDVTNPPDDSVSYLEFSETDNLLGVCSWDATIRVWQIDPQSKKADARVRYLEPTHDAVLRCCFTPDGRTIFWGTTSGHICCGPTDAPRGTTATTGTFGAGAASAYSTGRKQVTTTALPGMVVGLRYYQNKLLACTTHHDRKSSVVAFSDPLATSADQRKVVLYDLDLGYKFVSMSCVGDVAFFAVLGPAGSYILKCDLSKGEQPAWENVLNRPQFTGPITCLCGMPQGGPIGYMAGSLHGEVEMLVGDKSQSLAISRIEGSAVGSTPPKFESFATNCVATSLHGMFGLSGDSSGKLWLWNLESGVAAIVPGVEKSPVTACAISPDYQMYAFAAGYDWSRGADHYAKVRLPVKISIRLLADGLRKLEEAAAAEQQT
jgi:WD40 repeat protein